jgi:hypothetical protein
MATLNAYNLQVETDVPIHGVVTPFSMVGPLNKKQYENAQALCDDAFKAGFPIVGCPAKP